MWTPKRVLLLGVGIAFFLVGFGVYNFFLGRIDGLPPLPEDFLEGMITPISPETGDDIPDFMLRRAFGRECQQVKKTIRVLLAKKGMVLAAEEAHFNEPDGRVKLIDVSMALFKENSDKLPFPEINTLQCDVAWLTFDQPIHSLQDTSKAKLTGAELRGGVNAPIVIVNNRHTEAKHDDLEILVNGKPLFYDDIKGRIWTEGTVQLIDKQTKPDPTMVSGQGLDMLLSRDQPGDKKGGPPKVKSDLSGIELIVLKSTVRMDLYTESGFMGAPPPTAAANGKEAKAQTLQVEVDPRTGKPKEAEKSHITITTEGPFYYDVPRDLARFDSPPAKQNPTFPDQVAVIRTPMQNKKDPKSRLYDQLLCDHLELKFVREPAPGGAKDTKDGSSSGGGDRKIESAHATARPGMEVVLSLDTENLAAHCIDLTYECPKGDRGARTVLKGNPLEALKDGHKIKSRELVLIQANSKGLGQEVLAVGPGQVDLCDKDPDKGHTTHALWKGLLTSKKWYDGDREPMDLLTLTEDAVFIDDEHDQKLYGQRLQVWLETIDPSKEPSSPADPTENGLTVGGSRQRPTKVEAYDQVRAISPELKVSECSSLKLRFQDAPRAAMTLPEKAPASQGPLGQDLPPPPLPDALPPSSQNAPSGGKTPPVAQDPLPGGKSPPAATVLEAPKQDPKAQEKPKKQIDLKARDVVADIVRGEDKNDLKELVAEGDVHVHQDGETPKDKGVDIKGDALNLLHFPEGNVLRVYGTHDDRAELQLGDLFMVGPKVKIDEKENVASVDGIGGMHLPSGSNFDGGKPGSTTLASTKPAPSAPGKTANTKPPSTLTITWNRDMVFDGIDADFQGKVVAYQDDATLQSDSLQVAMDKKVIFKDGQSDKDKEKSQVKNMIAYGNVRVHDISKDDDGKFVAERSLTCVQLAVDNLQNRYNASGPGVASTLKYGEPDEALGPDNGKKSPKQPAAKKAPELQLTRVERWDRMHSTYINTTTRQTTFLGKVVVIHTPADRIDLPVDAANPPKGGMVLYGDELRILERELPDKTVEKSMEVQKNVFFLTSDMRGRAEKLTFDEKENIVTFTGRVGNPAQVFRLIGGAGSGWSRMEGQTIQYNRKTGLMTVDGVTEINGSTRLQPRLKPFVEEVALFRVGK